MVLTHSAGSDCRSPLLIALADALTQAGITVLRCDLHFRQQRPHGPPYRQDAAADRKGLRRALRALSERGLAPLFLAGHSYGGRQASMLAAEDPEHAAGVLLLSYPLHPPHRRAELRTSHFPSLRTPALFVHGDRDGFGSLSEMEAALKLIPAATRLMPVPAAGHDLGFGRNKQPELAPRVVQEFCTFFGLTGN